MITPLEYFVYIVLAIFAGSYLVNIFFSVLDGSIFYDNFLIKLHDWYYTNRGFKFRVIKISGFGKYSYIVQSKLGLRGWKYKSKFLHKENAIECYKQSKSDYGPKRKETKIIQIVEESPLHKALTKGAE